MTPCPRCDGTGNYRSMPRMTRWMFRACWKCKGSGYSGPRRIPLVRLCGRYGGADVTEFVKQTK